MASLYIIYSHQLDKYYSGITTESAGIRLDRHNTGFYGKKFTSQASDWELQLELKAQDIAHARRMELYIKKRKSKSYIILLIKDMDEQQKLLSRFYNKLNS